MSSIADRLIVVYRHEDKWPARVGELIADLTEWYAAHPALSEVPPDDIAAFLEDVWENEGSVHLCCVFTVNRDVTGLAEHTLNTSVVIDNLRRTLAGAAFERYALSDAA